MERYADLHTHTLVSGHAYSTLSEVIHAAAQRKLPILGITEHGPALPGSCTEMYYCNFKVIPREIEGVRLLLGCELNILDYSGTVDLKEETLERIDFAIASFHDLLLPSGTLEQNTDAILAAMENPHVNIIGHPDDGRVPLDYETVVKAARDRHRLLEVNNSSLSPNAFRLNARENYRIMLKYCIQYRVPVILGSDAHFAADVGNHSLALQLLSEAGFPEKLVANGSMELLREYIPALK